MTLQALTAIAGADFVLGHRPYLELIRDLLRGKEVESSGMGREVERARRAVALLEEGSVALVSGGDPNVYGMAGLGLELAPDLERVEVIPGMTSFTAAACRAGVVFREPVAVISLSDLLTSWSFIEKRLRLARELGMVTILYNPRSRRRNWQLERSLEICGEETDVLVARNVSRPGEEIFWTKACHLLEREEMMEKIDMSTLLILGGRGMVRGETSEGAGVCIVGLGPGGPSQLTVEAKGLLEGSAKIFGSKRYLHWIRGISRAETVSHEGSCSERMASRLLEARRTAEAGVRASILTGGDPSIFSSAWRILEADDGCRMRISPGVSAFSAAAAKAGAPLVSDFLLLPAPDPRIAELIGAGFGIAVYNLSGQALPAVLEGIHPDRPCALTRDVTREGECSLVSPASELLDAETDGSRFTLLVGSASSFIKQGRIVTKRGYEAKYYY
jgi:precorrin-3B C17-methyltransferase